MESHNITCAPALAMLKAYFLNWCLVRVNEWNCMGTAVSDSVTHQAHSLSETSETRGSTPACQVPTRLLRLCPVRKKKRHSLLVPCKLVYSTHHYRKKPEPPWQRLNHKVRKARNNCSHQIQPRCCVHHRNLSVMSTTLTLLLQYHRGTPIFIVIVAMLQGAANSDEHSRLL